MRRAGIAAWLLLLAATPLAWGADATMHQPDKRTVTVVGEAVIEGNDLPGAERAARADAVRKAVAQVIGVFVSGKASAENGRLIESIVRSKSQGMGVVKTVLEKTQEEGILKLKCDVEVSAVPLVQALKEAGLTREWRVMVIIPEQHLRRPVPDPAAETEFIRQFVGAGYKVIDQKRYAELRQQNADRLKDPAVAAEIGRKMGADIVITGEAFSESVPPVMEGVESCRARVETRAILADTAEIVAADAASGAGADLSEAVAGKTALQKTAGKLAPLFVRDISLLPGSDTRKIQLEVSTFRGFAAAARFERAVATIKGINKVTRESYDAGVLVLDIDSDVEKSDALAEQIELAEAMQPFELVVTNVSKTRIRAEVKPQQ
ncbi:MAG: hypothetical protein HY321_03435 [Armatimonadetes bacterium]|nr:hypothetical protein [Armatimonadota bacterium]